jgi:Flp pilus assembly pilin Flp
MIRRALRALVRDESGAAITEYALITGVVSLGSITAMIGIGTAVSNFFASSTTNMHNFMTGVQPP